MVSIFEIGRDCRIRLNDTATSVAKAMPASRLEKWKVGNAGMVTGTGRSDAMFSRYLATTHLRVPP